MQSFIIIGSKELSRMNEINARIHALGISPFDVITPESSTPSIGISDIKVFIKKLSLLPGHGASLAGVIIDAKRLTAQAQQALLKTLEEPPLSTYLFFGAGSTSELLPTIVSRCQSVFVTDHPMETHEEVNKTISFIATLVTACPGEKIRMIERIGKNKQEYVMWIDRTIEHLHIAGQFSLLRGLLAAKQYVGNNVNPQLVIEHAVLAATGPIEYNNE